MFKKIMYISAIFIPIFLIAGCGDVSTSGSTSLFETAKVTFTADYVTPSAKILSSSNVDDGTSANLTIVVTPFTNTLHGVSTFTVRDMRYIYTQTSGGTSNFTINGPVFGTALSYNPILASGTIKDHLLGLGFITDVSTWTFDVQAVYTVIEDYSQKTQSYSVPIGTVRFY